MKKKFLIFITLLLTLIPISSLLASAVNEEQPDSNLYCNITVSSRPDKTLDINFDINCKILKSNKEDISWIKIEFPNSDIDEITGISDNITEARLFEEDDCTYVRINLDNNYSTGDILNIKYSLHQLYTLKDDNSTIIDYFYPIQEFSEIYVDELNILWNSANVLSSSNLETNSDGYYIWNISFKNNEKVNIFMRYSLETSEEQLDETTLAEETEEESLGIFVVYIIIFIILLVLVVLSFLV
ncbi:MAG: hypothetical protein ACI4UE_00430 [Candidatus Scatovivens sp.]